MVEKEIFSFVGLGWSIKLRRRNECIRLIEWILVRFERLVGFRCKELCMFFFKEYWDFESLFSRKGGWSWVYMG